MPRILYLSTLCTELDFQGKAADGLLKGWGLDFARRKKIPVGLIASHQLSAMIYKHLTLLPRLTWSGCRRKKRNGTWLFPCSYNNHNNDAAKLLS